MSVCDICSRYSFASVAFAAWMMAGKVAQFVCGVILLSEPSLFEFAHYLKEDPTLVMAMSGVIVSLLAYERKPTATIATLVGIASGLCVSAKYVGVVYSMLALAALFIMARRGENFRHLTYFALAVICMILIVNWQFLFEIGNFRSGLGSEVELFEKSEQHLPNKRMFAMLVNRVGIIGLVALLSWVAWIRRRRLVVAEWAIFLMVVFYGLMLPFSTSSSSRYVFPITICMALVIPVGWSWLGEMLAEKFSFSRKWIGKICCVLMGIGILAFNTPQMFAMVRGFQYDSRLQTTIFLQGYLPVGSVIAEDDLARLPDALKKSRSLIGWDLPFSRVISPYKPLWQQFTIQELRAQGVTHIVLVEDQEFRTAAKHKLPKNTRVEKFFMDLLVEAKLIYSCSRGAPSYLHPGLYVYELKHEI